MRIAREMLNQWGGGEGPALSCDLIPPRDYSGLHIQDTEIRLWLPDQVKRALIEICEHLDVSITIYLTEFFATYLFGVHEIMRMRQNATGLYAHGAAQPSGTKTGAEDETAEDQDTTEYDDPIPELGKNIFSLKIFLPSPVKAGLQGRANLARVPLGRFARAMICAHVFGREVGPVRLLNSSRNDDSSSQAISVSDR